MGSISDTPHRRRRSNPVRRTTLVILGTPHRIWTLDSAEATSITLPLVRALDPHPPAPTIEVRL
ncbi:hypothetical protein [Rhodovulum sp. PH10]|uniref:hypothetical protein n=1 Tax=Rhodovulum sp. PH10 TaxID=1187851 RepID=UPI000304CBC7|nr:hypothetical protein [Rhodovulum sp. PH10]